jgi:hypothetical protein
MSFKASGLISHQRQSLDIRCQMPAAHPQFNDCDTDENMDIDPRDFIKDILPTMTSTGAEYGEFEVDPSGDLFGDYEDYIQKDSVLDCLDPNISDSYDESEGAIDEEGFFLTNDSEILEPERLPPSDDPLLSCPLPDELDSTTTKTIGKALRLRGGAEEVLQKRLFVVKFMKGNAGAIYANQHVDEDNLNASYTHKVGDAENPSPFSPFSSKLEWEIAHWAKMRGPSSTAFNKLIEIEDVSIISCQAKAAHN